MTSRTLGLSPTLRQFTITSKTGGARHVQLVLRSSVSVPSRRLIQTESFPPSASDRILNSQRLKRPSSPHFTIYQPQLTWIGSIANRITGSTLSVLLYGFSLSYLIFPTIGMGFNGADLIELVHSLPEWFKYSAKVLFGAPFAYHAWNGVRHLLWDSGKFLSLKGAYTTGYVVLGATAVTTVGLLVEAYSCKSINKDKKLFASLEHSYLEDMAATSSRSLPSDMTSSIDDTTPFGSLASPSARKTLYLLIATLNVAFPDYSFSTLRPDSFVREPSGAHILGALSSALVSPTTGSLGPSPPRSYTSYPPPSTNTDTSSSFPLLSSFHSLRHHPIHNSLVNSSSQPDVYSGVHTTLYKTLDDVIKLSECEVFSYSPDPNSDPHAGDSDDEQIVSDDDLSPSDEDYEDEVNQLSEQEEEEEYTFVFDEESISDEPVSASLLKFRWLHDPPRKRHNSSDFSALDSPKRFNRFRSSLRHRRPRTPLLWSSNWFFYNRRLKRIVFISIWARKKSWSTTTVEDGEEEEDQIFSSSRTGDSFKGWVGDVGAGARAVGLIAKSL
ncbi:hypothetical protein Clacol_002789 [Clathrus columnatus]|uniref:Succinate dehydrogenase cytochrome b560 subunit, mitochondrial n=1 Tax=Clathrus columnatus TaxID=1419009 RepID=A0AAV5A6I2_9AGAM|nr:hypothetical protein Clacol_002789 [Clathrus columnatus]